jgi:hypothetical protein
MDAVDKASLGFLNRFLCRDCLGPVKARSKAASSDFEVQLEDEIHAVDAADG